MVGVEGMVKNGWKGKGMDGMKEEKYDTEVRIYSMGEKISSVSGMPLGLSETPTSRLPRRSDQSSATLICLIRHSVTLDIRGRGMNKGDQVRRDLL